MVYLGVCVCAGISATDDNICPGFIPSPNKQTKTHKCETTVHLSHCIKMELIKLKNDILFKLRSLFLTQQSKVRFFLLLSNFSLSDIRGLYHDSVEVRIPSLE